MTIQGSTATHAAGAPFDPPAGFETVEVLSVG